LTFGEGNYARIQCNGKLIEFQGTQSAIGADRVCFVIHRHFRVCSRNIALKPIPNRKI
jgi:hypothetical protein